MGMDMTRAHSNRAARTENQRAPQRVLPERRAVERQLTDGLVLISPGHEGALVDWSARGFAVESDQAVRVGGTYRLHWRLGGASKPLAGIVRWSRLRRTIPDSEGDVTPIFRTGFELIGLPTAGQAGGRQNGVS